MSEPILSFSGKYRFLSNFWPVSVELRDEDGPLYPSIEHAFQAAKTLDLDQRREIRFKPSPGAAKRAGREVTLRPDWEQVKIGIMRDLIYQKFDDPVLRRELQMTGDAYLIEGNNWGDKFWGKVDGGKGDGLNWLGIILMEVRAAWRDANEVSCTH